MQFKSKRMALTIAAATLLASTIALSGCQKSPDVTVTGSPDMDAKLTKRPPIASANGQGQPGQSPAPAFESQHRPKKTSP